MGIPGKQEKHKLWVIVDSWKEKLTSSEYDAVRKGLYIALPVLAMLLIAEPLVSLFKKDHEAFRTLTLSLAAIIGLPLLAWRGVSLDRSSKAAERQAENALKQAEIASKIHVADTYSRAIEQLGSVDSKGEPSLELRLGGLYALEKIAKANADYHPQIMEVLCAYVRMHCIRNNKEVVSFIEENNSKQNIGSLGIDVQACLTVIGRREVLFDTKPLDLVGVQLMGASLRGARFIKADFTKADLSNTDLIEANFSQADFMGAFLINVILIRANLSGANLLHASLNEAHLSKADFSEAKNLTCEQIESANIDRETILPDYIKITWAEDGTYTCKMVEDSK